MNEYLKKAKPHPHFRLEIAQREMFLKADGWRWRKLLDTNFSPFQKETMQSVHYWWSFTPCRCSPELSAWIKPRPCFCQERLDQM